ncbi:MAG: hypothetical protein ACXV8T_17425 [Acidimicrobiia bacterium]
MLNIVALGGLVESLQASIHELVPAGDGEAPAPARRARSAR